MTDEYFSEEFESYRKLEIEKGINVLHGVISGMNTPDFMKGAMWMLKAIINLPEDMAKTKEAKERAAFLKGKMLGEFEAGMIRKFLESSE